MNRKCSKTAILDGLTAQWRPEVSLYTRLYSHESDFLDGLLKQKQLAHSFNFSFRYIDDVLSLNNSRFGDFLHLIYPSQLEIKDTTDTVKSASYLDLHLEIDTRGRLYTKLHEKHDNFDFPVMNFPFFSGNI